MTSIPAPEKSNLRKRRRVLWALAGVLLVAACVGMVAIDPAARVQGWAHGEPFHQGKSATAWQRELAGSDQVAAAAEKSLADAKAAHFCGWLLECSPNPDVRRRAAESLLQMGKDAAPAGPALITAAADPNRYVRGVAIRAIGGLAPDLPGAVPALVKRTRPDRTSVNCMQVEVQE